MEPIYSQPTTNQKPKKVVITPIGPPKPRRDMRFIDGKIRVVEVIGDKIIRVIGEKKNPYKDITEQAQEKQKEDKATSLLTPLPESGSISTLSTVKIDTKIDTKTDVKIDDIVNIKSGQEVLDISVLKEKQKVEIPKIETGVTDTKKETTKDTVPTEQNVPKEETTKKEPVNFTNIISSQAFLSGTGSTINDILNHPVIEKKDIKDVSVQESNQESKLETKPEVIKETIKGKEDIKAQPVIPINIGNLTGKLDSKAKDLTKKIIENTKLNKDTIKEAKRMGDENQRQIDEELIAKGVDRRLKDINFNKSIDDAVKFAGESRTKLTDLHKEFGDIEEKVGTIGKSVGEMCDGVDCIKKDFKNAQERQTGFEKQVANGLETLAEKVQKLEEPSYICDNCGENAIKALNSYCPNCGNPIPQWTGEDGHTVPGWKPYWMRLKEAKTS